MKTSLNSKSFQIRFAGKYTISAYQKICNRETRKKDSLKFVNEVDHLKNHKVQETLFLARSQDRGQVTKSIW